MTAKSVGLVYDQIMGEHRATDFEWERPERIYSIYQLVLQEGLMTRLKAIPSRRATYEELEHGHSKEYITKTTTTLKKDKISFPSVDMFANKDTLDSARVAAGSTLELTKSVIEGELQSGFAIVRPPGHHALPGKCMGFCYFNNVGISAVYAARQGKRVMIVDIDVHHGNGTERLVSRRHELRNISFISIHRWDNGTFYPGTGRVRNTGRVMNIPFNGTRGDEYYRDVFRNRIVPKAGEFCPEIIIVSCGFDAAEGDPLGECHVTPRGYFDMISILQGITPSLVLVLEGGYNLESTSKSAVACIQALLGDPFDEVDSLSMPYSEIKKIIE